MTSSPPSSTGYFGAEATLVQLGGEGVVLGIISGAMEGACRTKLIPANLNRYFLFGGYGSDSPDRAEITKGAIARAGALCDHLTPGDVYVVGDTPHDITAANAVGAVSVGVASGQSFERRTAAAGAHHVMGSLEERFPGLD